MLNNYFKGANGHWTLKNNLNHNDNKEKGNCIVMTQWKQKEKKLRVVFDTILFFLFQLQFSNELKNNNALSREILCYLCWHTKMKAFMLPIVVTRKVAKLYSNKSEYLRVSNCVYLVPVCKLYSFYEARLTMRQPSILFIFLFNFQLSNYNVLF